MSVTENKKSSSPIKSALHSLSKHMKEHHANVQFAYETYYGAGMQKNKSASSTATNSANNSGPSSPRHSTSSHRLSSTWDRIKQHTKDNQQTLHAATLAHGMDCRIDA